jgi:hypothetical protein
MGIIPRPLGRFEKIFLIPRHKQRGSLLLIHRNHIINRKLSKKDENRDSQSTIALWQGPCLAF